MKNIALVLVGVCALVGNINSTARAAVKPACDRSEPIKVVLQNLLKKSCDTITESDLLTLKRLDVSRRKIQVYHPDDFTGLGNLEILNIRSNPAPELPEGLLRDLTHLKTLVIIGAGLSKFPEDFLDSNPDVENLHLFRLKATSVPAAVIDRLEKMTHLKEIDLDRIINDEDKARLSQIFPTGGPVQLFFR